MLILFDFLKAIVKVSLRFFYSKTTFENRDRGFFSHPCIVVSNHPSTVMDPLNAVAWIGPRVKFLANASLFNTPFTNWFFNTFYCIKVERYQDTGGKPLNNENAFIEARKHLENKGCLYLAPEGGSFPDRQLRKLKTGFARIAFDAESSNEFELGLTILPVGLNYGDPRQFRTELFTKFGTHIYVRDFQQKYEENPKEATRKLTEVLTAKLSALVIDTKDEEEEWLQRKLETMMRNEDFLPPEKDFKRSKRLLEEMRILEENDRIKSEKLRRKVKVYFQKLSGLKISDQVLKKPKHRIWEILTLFFGLPLFMLGFLTNFFPTYIPFKINKHFNRDGSGSYDSTFKYVSGLVIVPLFYWFQIKLIKWQFEIDWNSLIYISCFIAMGLFAEWYLKIGQLYIEKNRLKSFDAKKNLFDLRKDILETFNFELTSQK